MEINYTLYLFAFLKKAIKKLLAFCYWSQQINIFRMKLESPS